MEEEVRPILRRVQSMENLLRRVSTGAVVATAPERLAYLRAVLHAHLSFEATGEAADE
jgi:hypothetical protein